MVAAPGAHDPAVRLWSRVPVGSSRSRAAPGSAQYFSDLRDYRYSYETPFIPRMFGFERMARRSLHVLHDFPDHHSWQPSDDDVRGKEALVPVHGEEA